MRVSVAAAICLSVIGLSGAAEVQAAIKRQTNIPAQGLGPALQTLAKERNFQLVYVSEEINDVRTAGAVGELTSEEALQRLLIGTGLTFRYLDEETVTIVPVGGSPPSATSSAASASPHSRAQAKGFWSRFRLAQAESASRVDERTPSGEQGPSQIAEENSKKRIELEEIIVTGTNIRGVYPASSPVDIYTAEDIRRTGAITTEQFIQKLPQNLGTRAQYAPASLAFPNRESVNGVDLRGLGVGTTLTLLNGRRLALASNGQAADVSLIPASAIERIEVLTDGASAIYGSDAIGGVVNFVLRDDFDGAETRLSYGGVTSGSLRQENLTQTFGGQWNSGNALFSYDYFDASALETGDRTYATFSGPGYLTPDEQRHSAFGTLSQDLGDRLSIDGDFAFSRRTAENFSTNQTSANPLNYSNTRYSSQTEQYFANLGVNAEISDSLNGSMLASYSTIDVDTRAFTDRFNAGTASTSTVDTSYAALDVTAILDGALLALPAGQIRFSLGGGLFDEQYLAARTFGGALSGRDLGRTTTYAFGELLAPLIGEEQNVPLVRRLELSLAARYTKYDDASEPSLGREFGDKTSPKIGVLWAPVPAFNVRATFGESFRAPSLTQIDPSEAINALQQPFAIAGVPSTVLLVGGASPELGPETAQSFTFGFEFRPTVHPGFHFSTTYFNIDYVDRIASPNPLPARANPAAWPDLVYRASSAAQIEALLRSTGNTFNNTGIGLTDLHAASLALFDLPDLWINDVRSRNLSLTALDGFDLSIGNRFDTSWGEVVLGGQLTRILDYREQATSTAPVISVVDTLLRPVDLRGRVYAGLTRGRLQSTVSINYVDDYENPLPGGVRKVDSWTTVDWNLAYDFGQNKEQGFIGGVRLNLSVQNLFDQDPPLVASNNDATIRLNNSAGFDPANANPLGRFVVFGITKAW